MNNQFMTAIAAREFILSGAAVFTIVSEETGEHYTFKVEKGDNIHFVKLRIGSENNPNFVYLGVIKYGLFKLTGKSNQTLYSKPFRAFQYMWQRLVRDQIAPKLQIWHVGKCGRCGRPLTDPVSIERGFGPECQEIIDAAKKPLRGPLTIIRNDGILSTSKRKQDPRPMSLERIRKLLNMTVANGCTEDEQETAMSMAASLAARAGIELDQLRAKDAPKRKAKDKFHSQEFKPHQAFAASAAATLYGIECNAYNLGADGLMFVGREDLIELAEETMFWLFRQIEQLYKTSLPKGMSKRDRAEYRKTFKVACAMRVQHRAEELIREMKTNQAKAQAATGQNALVVTGYFDEVQAEVDDYWNEKFAARQRRHEEWLSKLTPAERAEHEAHAKKQAEKPMKSRRSRSIPQGIGTNAGYAAGEHVQLRKEVQ